MRWDEIVSWGEEGSESDHWLFPSKWNQKVNHTESRLRFDVGTKK